VLRSSQPCGLRVVGRASPGQVGFLPCVASEKTRPNQVAAPGVRLGPGVMSLNPDERRRAGREPRPQGGRGEGNGKRNAGARMEFARYVIFFSTKVEGRARPATEPRPLGRVGGRVRWRVGRCAGNGRQAAAAAGRQYRKSSYPGRRANTRSLDHLGRRRPRRGGAGGRAVPGSEFAFSPFHWCHEGPALPLHSSPPRPRGRVPRRGRVAELKDRRAQT